MVIGVVTSWGVGGAEGVTGMEGEGVGVEGWRREVERRLARGGKPLQRERHSRCKQPPDPTTLTDCLLPQTAYSHKIYM